MAQALLLHEVGEHARVRGQAGDGDADVGVDGEEFLLVRGEFFGISLRVDVRVSFMVVVMGVRGGVSMGRWCGSYLDGYEHCMCLACYSHDDGALLDCLCGVFDLEDPALWRAGGLRLG